MAKSKDKPVEVDTWLKESRRDFQRSASLVKKQGITDLIYRKFYQE